RNQKGALTTGLVRLLVAPIGGQDFAPIVIAGDSQTIYANQVLILNGRADDDSSTLTTTWSASPSTGVSFDNPNQLNTGVTFPSAGDYVLTLNANDMIHSVSDTLNVHVLPEQRPPMADIFNLANDPKR